MHLFVPNLTLVKEPDDEYTVFSVTLTPDSCYAAGPVTEGAPEGVVVVPEAIPLQLQLVRRGEFCLQVITAVGHTRPNLKFGEGKDRVVCFVVLGSAVLGSATARPEMTAQARPRGVTHTFRATAFGALERDDRPPLTSQFCIDVVHKATGCTNCGDELKTLFDLGVTPGREDVYKAEVQRQLGFDRYRIEQRNIKGAPENTVGESAASIQRHAH